MHRAEPQIRGGFADFDRLRSDAASEPHHFFVERRREEQNLQRQLHGVEQRDHRADVGSEVAILQHMIRFIDDQALQLAPVVAHGLHCVLHRVCASDHHLRRRVEGNAFERAGALDGGQADQLAAHFGDLQSELARVDQNEDLRKLHVLIDVRNGPEKEADGLSAAVLGLDDNVMAGPRGNGGRRTHWLKM